MEKDYLSNALYKTKFHFMPLHIRLICKDLMKLKKLQKVLMTSNRLNPNISMSPECPQCSDLKSEDQLIQLMMTHGKN